MRIAYLNCCYYFRITICMSSPFNTDYAAEKLAAANIHQITDETATNFYILELLNLSSSEKKQMTSFDKTLVFCTFMGVSCSASDFTYMYHPFYTNCYRFNADGSKRQTITGAIYCRLMCRLWAYFFELVL
jgi:hypothetical protein